MLYFSSFTILVAFTILNLVVAVILDKFVESASDEGLFRNTDFFEILQKKMILDRFISRLKHKVSILWFQWVFWWPRTPIGNMKQGVLPFGGSAPLNGHDLALCQNSDKLK